MSIWEKIEQSQRKMTNLKERITKVRSFWLLHSKKTENAAGNKDGQSNRQTEKETKMNQKDRQHAHYE